MANKVQAITVDQLIEALQKLPPSTHSLPVYAEGCDCYGEATGVRWEPDGDTKGFILVTR